MPAFEVEPLIVTVDEFIERCLPYDIDKLLRRLKEDFEDDMEDLVHPSPYKFLQQCSTGELYETHDLIHEDYSRIIHNDDTEPRSDGQRIFNKHLQCLKESWYSISKEDGYIIEILAKKYGDY